MSNDKVHHLNVVPAAAQEEKEIREDTIAILKEALAEVEAGRGTEVILVLRMEGGWKQLASPTTDFLQWIGRMEVFKSEWIEKHREWTAAGCPEV